MDVLSCRFAFLFDCRVSPCRLHAVDAAVPCYLACPAALDVVCHGSDDKHLVEVMQGVDACGDVYGGSGIGGFADRDVFVIATAPADVCACGGTIDAADDEIACAAGGVVTTAVLVGVCGRCAVGDTLRHSAGERLEVHCRSQVLVCAAGEEHAVVLECRADAGVGGHEMRHLEIPACAHLHRVTQQVEACAQQRCGEEVCGWHHRVEVGWHRAVD